MVRCTLDRNANLLAEQEARLKALAQLTDEELDSTDIPPMTDEQFYGLQLDGPPQPIVLPHLFTPEELEILSIPCHARTGRQRTLNSDWLDKGGGIANQALGIHVGHLKLYPRLQARVAEMLD